MFSLFARRPRAAAPPPDPAGAPVDAALARAARLFAPEPPETVALAAESLRALAGASPRFADGRLPNPTPLAWLDAALTALERLPGPPPAAGRAPRPAWRYPLFVRVLCDHLEAAYGELARRGIAARCPLTDLPDPFAPARPTHPPRREPDPPEGLGALVAGTRLPEAGRRRLLEACAEGVPWPDSAAFWRWLGAGSAGGPAPATAVPTPGGPGTARPTPPAPPDLDPLDAAARAALAALVAAPGFNRHAGDAWSHGGALYVAAQAFARELLLHPRVRSRPDLQNRKALYRHLRQRGLVAPDGAQSIRHLWVCEDGHRDPRYVSALQMADALSAGLAADPFAGWLRPASRRDARPVQSP